MQASEEHACEELVIIVLVLLGVIAALIIRDMDLSPAFKHGIATVRAHIVPTK